MSMVADLEIDLSGLRHQSWQALRESLAVYEVEIEYRQTFQISPDKRRVG
jgi:hypothetical protein